MPVKKHIIASTCYYFITLIKKRAIKAFFKSFSIFAILWKHACSFKWAKEKIFVLYPRKCAFFYFFEWTEKKFEKEMTKSKTKEHL
jgi:hypothetical protein